MTNGIDSLLAQAVKHKTELVELRRQTWNLMADGAGVGLPQVADRLSQEIDQLNVSINSLLAVRGELGAEVCAALGLPLDSPDEQIIAAIAKLRAKVEEVM
jgi:hypothetical protein